MWECRKCHERHETSFEVCWNCGTSKEGVEDPTFARTEEGERASEATDQSITAARPKQGPRQRAPARTLEQLIYVGLNGYALALDRDTGEIVWSNNQMASGYVTLRLDGDRLIVSSGGRGSRSVVEWLKSHGAPGAPVDVGAVIVPGPRLKRKRS
jgi:hypothetical protein